MKTMILGAGALLLTGGAAVAAPPVGSPDLAQAMAEAGLQVSQAAGARSTPDQWTGVGGPEETSHHSAPSSAMSGTMALRPKDESLPRMETRAGRAAEAGDKDAEPGGSQRASDAQRDRADEDGTGEEMRKRR